MSTTLPLTAYSTLIIPSLLRDRIHRIMSVEMPRQMLLLVVLHITNTLIWATGFQGIGHCMHMVILLVKFIRPEDMFYIPCQ